MLSQSNITRIEHLIRDRKGKADKTFILFGKTRLHIRHQYDLRFDNQSCFLSCLKILESRGWTILPDPDVKKNFPSLNSYYRIGMKGNLLLRAEFGPNNIDFKISHRDNDHQTRFYGTDWEYHELRYLDRKLVDLTFRNLGDYFLSIGFVDRTEPHFKTTDEQVEYLLKTDGCEHSHQDLASYNRKDADGQLLSDGEIKYFFDPYSGVLRRGTIRHHINSMWYVITKETVYNLSAFDLFSFSTKRCLTRRYKSEWLVAKMRARLERAISGRDYSLAQILSDQLQRAERRPDKGEPPVIITKKDLYYRGGALGYTKDLALAGLFTKQYAIALCKENEDLAWQEFPTKDEAQAA